MTGVNENKTKKEYLDSYRESKEAVKRIEEQIKEFELYETSPMIISMDKELHGSRVKKDLSNYMARKEEIIGRMI